MRVGEALARSPELALLPPDPETATELWEQAARGLEGIGAAVESERPGEAFFSVDGLLGIHRSLDGLLAAIHRTVQRGNDEAVPASVGVAPTRFAAAAAARLAAEESASVATRIVETAELHRFLAVLPLSTVVPRLAPPQPPIERLVLTLSRLGIRSLGELAELSVDDVADRFGPLGLRAHALARGEDEPLHPRRPQEELVAELDLPEACGGEQLDRALQLLVDRLLAAPERRDRTVLALRLGAKLAGGGSWWQDVALRKPTASAETMRTVLSLKLALLPAPAAALTLRATSLGSDGGEQLELSCLGEEERDTRLAEAARQVRALEGPEALLKVLDVDARSRVPERRSALTAFQPEARATRGGERR
jgi:protein ImuB